MLNQPQTYAHENTHMLPMTRYSLSIRAEQPLRLPAYAGSMLRGAFGNALRRLACMTRQKDCTGCPLLTTCPYPMIFETPAPAGHPLQSAGSMPNPYVIEPPRDGVRMLAAGDTFEVGVVLIGQALDQLALIVLAWEQALQRGLGPQHARCRLQSVHAEGDAEPVYVPGGRVRAHRPNRPAAPVMRDRVTLRFVTPLRLVQQGHCIGRRELDAPLLLNTLVRRHRLLLDCHVPAHAQQDVRPLAQRARDIRLQAETRWFDWDRYSSRQQQKMTLGGQVGDIHLEGDLTPFADLLHAGQWLHVGKNASFGLGHYQLIPSP